jgi:integrase
MEDIVMARKKDHHLFQINGRWYFQMKGAKVCLHTASKVEARRLRDQYHREMLLNGRIESPEPKEIPVFGALAKKWFELKQNRLKRSTIKDYRNNMNNYILPRFGKTPIDEIDYLSIETFINELGVKNKRSINMLIPMRNVFKLAVKAGYIKQNPVSLLDPIAPEKPDINPLTFDEVRAVIENVDPHYKNFFTVAFFTGMRFGEMAGLKWKCVDFRLRVIRVRETLVLGEEGPPKTVGSNRDIGMLPPVMEALRDQRKFTLGKSEFVFLNRYGRPLTPDAVRTHAWADVLKKTGIEYRTLMQTRHTYACLMLNAGVVPGYVMKQMGHTSLKMIYEHYYTYIKDYDRDEGKVFIERVYLPEMMKSGKSTPILPQEEVRGKGIEPNPLISL